MKKIILKSLFILLICSAACSFFCACKKTSVVESVATDSPVQTEAVPQTVSFALATPTPSPEPTPTPVPTPRELGRYTIAWMSDPQYYTRQNNGVFEIMTEYLKTHCEELRLGYIVFTGDFVHEHEKEEQWIIADKAMCTIDDIPNGVLAGNHDVGTDPTDYDYSAFTKYFGQARYASKPWYGGSYENNRGHYDLVSLGQTDYIFVYLGFQVEDEGLAWVKSVFDEYPDRVGILCVHGYFDTDLTLLEEGERLKEQVVIPCKNVYIVMCGHRYNSACIPLHCDDDGDGNADRTVLQMISNYQAIGDKKAKSRTGGDGYIRFFDVDEASKTVSYYTYSPYLDDYSYFDEEKHRKEKYAFDPASESGSFTIPWM